MMAVFPGNRGFDFNDTDRFSYDTPSETEAKAFHKAPVYAIDHELVAMSVAGGYGGAVYGGAFPAVTLR